MLNKIQAGKVIEWLNGTGATVKSGDVVVIGALIGVAVADIIDGDTGSVDLSGVFELPKLAGQSFAFGAKLYWDATAKNLTTTVTSNTFTGNAWLPAASAATIARVVLANGF